MQFTAEELGYRAIGWKAYRCDNCYERFYGHRGAQPKEDLASRPREIEALRAAFAGLAEQNARLERDLEALREDSAGLKSAHADALAAMAERARSFQERNGELERAFANVQATLAEHVTRVRRMEEELAEVRLESERLQAQNEQSSIDLAELYEENEHLRSTRAQRAEWRVRLQEAPAGSSGEPGRHGSS